MSDLKPWPRNPRQIKEDQARRLGESLEEFGQPETIAIGPDNEIYNGHQRLSVWMNEHGPDFEVDVRVSSRKLTEKEREKLTVYLHKGAAGEWDYDLLANEFDIGDLLEWGFEDFELGVEGWGEEPPPDDPGAKEDKAEELRQEWGVEMGQLWRLGEHTLLIWDQLTGVNISNQSKYLPHRSLVIILWFGERERFHKYDALKILHQNGIAESFASDIPQYIPIVRKYGSGKELLHEGVKPTALCDFLISLYSERGEMIGDPFAGSGSFLISAHKLGRRYHGSEIDPASGAVILDRFERTFGITGELVG